ncbi:protein kinase [Kribbella sp. NBC_00662]|uniref:serine/threonine-protein kinase n=1 Tax=Kribbella sp. NBC_00662 TaxID=2975969 RepID=UPI0032531018
MDAFAGRYRLIDLVGTGGMGSVWRAWDLRRSAYVAAKVLGQHDAATLLRFVREQSLRIEHPHVVAPHGWAADDDKVVFAMDLVGGGSVATLLGDHGPLPASYVAVLVDQLLHGLSAVHAAGVVHRDVKPANLLLDPTGTGRPHLRLSDFGVAGLVDEPRMTRHSTILGTPGYLAPEQLAGADPDPRQDLYAVGAVVAELLTGTRPGADGKVRVVDGPLGDFVRHLTATDPSDRPTSANESGRLLAETGVLPPPDTAPWSATPDSPEVFNQLPPLPPPWTPTGPTPTPATPPRATPDAGHQARDGATPGAASGAGPAGGPTGLPSIAEPTPVATVPPAAASEAGRGVALGAAPGAASATEPAAGPAAGSTGLPTVQPTAAPGDAPGAGHGAWPAVGPTRPPTGETTSASAAHTAELVVSPGAATAAPPAGATAASPAAAAASHAASRGPSVGVWVLRWVAGVGFVGAAGLLGAAVWLLVR